MVNLLFNSATKLDQDLMLIKTKPSVVEVVLFEANPGYTEQDVQKALASLNDVLKLYYGFVERTTANNGEGKYIDIVYWTDIKSAKDAASDILKNEKALAVFNVVKQESVEMYHFDAFNQFEE
ncbi:hypothetical protein [Aquimarina sp. AU474]|uniref:hypothetical protein n=1 Tax=Aquimarina sp. AU474 TaxID=2108529 RepID=UPI000D693C52|nr:hypothetical protein [Aquimarina sp. AU474]